jgi:hypothetical protein
MGKNKAKSKAIAMALKQSTMGLINSFILTAPGVQLKIKCN